MKCPYCGNEMINGFIQSSRGVFFATEEHSAWFLPNTSKGEFFISSNNWTAPTCVASYHCSDCKKVVIDYTKKPE